MTINNILSLKGTLPHQYSGIVDLNFLKFSQSAILQSLLAGFEPFATFLWIIWIISGPFFNLLKLQIQIVLTRCQN